MKLLRGPIAATLTPFTKTGAVDYRKIPEFANFLLDRGLTGLWVCGTSGEVATLMVDERKQLIDVWVNEVAGEVPVVAHVGHPNTAAAVDMARHAARVGAEVIACCSPFPPAPAQEALETHFRAVRDATDLPFFIYIIPVLAPLEFSADQLDALRRKIRCAGIKYSVPDVMTFARLRQLAGKSFNMLSGIDEVAVPFALSCVNGTVGLGHNCIPELFAALHRFCDQGRIDEAKALQEAYNAFTHATPEGVSIAARTKVAIRMRGLDLGETRSPAPYPRGAKLKAVEKAWTTLLDCPPVANVLI